MNEKSPGVPRAATQAGAGWVARQEHYGRMLALSEDSLLCAADLRVSKTVADVACGPGAATVQAARRLASAPQVLARIGPAAWAALHRSLHAALAPYLEADAIRPPAAARVERATANSQGRKS